MTGLSGPLSCPVTLCWLPPLPVPMDSRLLSSLFDPGLNFMTHCSSPSYCTHVTWEGRATFLGEHDLNPGVQEREERYFIRDSKDREFGDSASWVEVL